MRAYASVRVRLHRLARELAVVLAIVTCLVAERDRGPAQRRAFAHPAVRVVIQERRILGHLSVAGRQRIFHLRVVLQVLVPLRLHEVLDAMLAIPVRVVAVIVRPQVGPLAARVDLDRGRFQVAHQAVFVAGGAGAARTAARTPAVVRVVHAADRLLLAAFHHLPRGRDNPLDLLIVLLKYLIAVFDRAGCRTRFIAERDLRDMPEARVAVRLRFLTV